VLHDLSLDVRAGELIGLLGPSGSGKTTLLRIIAGLDAPDRGRILFGDDDATGLAVQERAVGFVFQHYALFKHMSVADNIAYGLNARRRADRPAKAEIKRRVGDLLDLIRLSGFGDRYPSQLSGGQRQRVALARALAVEPRVLLLDEPFGALDAQVRKDLRRWLREIHDRTGQTTIFVTHDQDEALELSDRVAVLDRGRLEQVGTPDEVQENPASATVMKFLGDSVEVEAIAEGGRVLVRGRETPVAAPAGPSVRSSSTSGPGSCSSPSPRPRTCPARCAARTGRRAASGSRWPTPKVASSPWRISTACATRPATRSACGSTAGTCSGEARQRPRGTLGSRP